MNYHPSQSSEIDRTERTLCPHIDSIDGVELWKAQEKRMYAFCVHCIPRMI